MIRGHKKINSGVIQTANDKGVVLKTFYSLLEKFNKQYEYEPLVVTKLQLWDLCGFTGKYEHRNMGKLIEVLTKSGTYNLKNKTTISGSMFVTEELGDGTIKIYIPEPFRKYLFYKRDIDLMTKAKRKEIFTTPDLDYYENEVKIKSKELVLLNKAHILGLKGKYNVRLYTLLKQWDKIKEYKCNWLEFRKIMEIPDSYIVSMIDKRILNPAIDELLKAGIKITKITKKKEGRSIVGIKINFKLEEDEKKEVKPIKPKDSKSIKKNKQSLNTLEDKFKKSEDIEIKLSEKEIEKAIKKCMEVEGIDRKFLEHMQKKSNNIFLNTIKKYVK